MEHDIIPSRVLRRNKTNGCVCAWKLAPGVTEVTESKPEACTGGLVERQTVVHSERSSDVERSLKQSAKQFSPDPQSQSFFFFFLAKQAFNGLDEVMKGFLAVFKICSVNLIENRLHRNS